MLTTRDMFRSVFTIHAVFRSDVSSAVSTPPVSHVPFPFRIFQKMPYRSD